MIFQPSRLQPLTYGVGSIGTGIFTTVPSVLLLYFLNTIVQIDVAIAGIIILIPKALGLVGDPLIGAWADRLRRTSPIGRWVLMSTGALLAGGGLWALFSVPQLYPGNVFLPALIYFTCTTGYSLFAVPYSSLPAELDERPEGRRRLVSTRLGISFLGTLIGGAGAPLIVARLGYPGMGIAVGTTCVVAMGTFLFACPLPEKYKRPQPTDTAIAADTARSVLTTPFIIQIAAFVLLMASIGAFSALLPFLVRDIGAAVDIVGFAMLVSILAALLSSAVWPSLIHRLGLRTTWQLAAAIIGISAALVGMAPGVGYLFYLGMAIGGAGMSGVQIAGFTGLADLTAGFLNKNRGAGLITGIWMAGEKAGLASGPLLAGSSLKFMDIAMIESAARYPIALIPIVLAIMSILIIAFDPTGRRTNNEQLR